METEAHTNWVNFPKTTLLVNDSLEPKLGSDSYAEDLVIGCTTTNTHRQEKISWEQKWK